MAAADTYSVTVKFRGGPIGGEMHVIPYDHLRQGYRVPSVGGPTTPRFVSERDILPPAHVEIEVHNYVWTGEREFTMPKEDFPEVFVMRWEDPVPAMRDRLKKAEYKIRRMKEVLDG